MSTAVHTASAPNRTTAGTQPRHRHRSRGLAAAAVLIVYVLVFAIMPKRVFWAPDEGGRFIQTESIRLHGGLTYALPYAGQRLDPEMRFFPISKEAGRVIGTFPARAADGQLEFAWPIWFALISRFAANVFGFAGLYVLPLACGWLIAWISGRILFAFDRRLAAGAILLTGLASPVAFYSQTFWDHTPAAVLATAAASGIVLHAPRGRTLVVAVCFLSAAMLLRLEMLAFGVAFALTIFLDRIAIGRHSETPVHRQWRRPARVAVILFSATIIGGLLLLNLPERHRTLQRRLPVTTERVVAKIKAIPPGLTSLLVNSSSSEGPVVLEPWPTLCLIAIVGVVVAGVVGGAFEHAAIVVGFSAILLFSEILYTLSQPYRSLHGFVPAAPWVLLGIWAMPYALRSPDSRLRRLTWLTASYVVFGLGANLLAYTGRDGTLWNTLEWGPRYLLTAFPLLAVLALWGLRTLLLGPTQPTWRRLATILVAGLVVIGAQQQLRGLSMLYEQRQIIASWDQVLRGKNAVVTDRWWVLTSLAPLLSSQDIFYVADRDELSAWVDMAAQHRIEDFIFASDHELSENDLAALPGVSPGAPYPAERLLINRFTIDRAR